MGAYSRQVLYCDVASGVQRSEERGETFWRRYPGPGLYGTKMLLEQTRPGLDALAAESPLIFGTAVAGGHLGPGLARYGVVGKSPLSGGIFESRGEGPLARALKGTGWAAVVLTGQAQRPVYGLFKGGELAWLDAEELWGIDTVETTRRLRARHGAAAEVAVIGLAGERGVRFAGIVSGGAAHQTQRGGLGAVMGAKRVKALVFTAPEYPAVADPEGVARLDRLFREEGVAKNPLNVWQKVDPGSSYWLDNVVDPGYVASRNGTRHDYGAPAGMAKERYAAFQTGMSACPGCANDCIKTFGETGAGAYWETLAALAIQLDLQRPEVYFELLGICQRYGMDVVSAGAVLAFAAEGVERGWLDVGYPVEFGGEGCLRLLDEIGQRRGVGEWLGEGVARAAERLGGEGARRAALTVKRVECTPIEARTQTNLALGYATAAGGPQGDICEHDWDYDTTVGWEHTLERSATLGILERVEMGAQVLGKVRNYRALNLTWSGTDAVGVCLYASAPTRYLRLEQIAELVGRVTGWDYSSHELLQAGERRNVLQRWYNYREGFTAADDELPERWHEEAIATGRHAGARLERETWGKVVGLYYAMCGWDEGGRPGAAKLWELGLEELLEKR